MNKRNPGHPVTTISLYNSGNLWFQRLKPPIDLETLVLYCTVYSIVSTGIYWEACFVKVQPFDGRRLRPDVRAKIVLVEDGTKDAADGTSPYNEKFWKETGTKERIS